jgi:hypothetical protein
MHLLMSPLVGAFFVISIVLFVIKLWALVDACLRPESAYAATGKQSKVFWIVILVIALVLPFGFLAIIGLVAALVYLLDVRPAVRGLGR